MGQGFYESGGAEFGNREKFPHRCFGDIFLAILLLFFLYFFNSHAPIILVGRLVLSCSFTASAWYWGVGTHIAWPGVVVGHFWRPKKLFLSAYVCGGRGSREQGGGVRGRGSGVGGGLGGFFFVMLRNSYNIFSLIWFSLNLLHYWSYLLA